MKHNEIRRSVIYVVARLINGAHYAIVTINNSDYRFAPKLRVSAFPVVDLTTDGDVTVSDDNGIYTILHTPSGSGAELLADLEECTFRGRYLSSGAGFSGRVEGLTVSLSDDEIGATITAILSDPPLT